MLSLVSLQAAAHYRRTSPYEIGKMGAGFILEQCYQNNMCGVDEAVMVIECSVSLLCPILLQDIPEGTAHC